MLTLAQLDRQDRAILRLLQENNKMPQRTLADQVKLSAAAVQRRTAAMEAGGIILRHVALLDPDAMAATITSIVEVTLIDEHALTVDDSKALFLATPEVQQCFYVTGGISFVLIIVTADMRAYAGLIRRMLAENPKVRAYRSLVALDRVKTGMAIVIP